MYELRAGLYGGSRGALRTAAGGVSQRGASGSRGGAGLKREGCRAGCASRSGAFGSSVVAAGSGAGGTSSAFVRRQPKRDAVTATTPSETTAPSTTIGTTPGAPRRLTRRL